MIDERAPNSMNMTPSQMEHQPIQDKRVYTVDEIQDILEIGRTSAYSLVKQNLFRSVRVGGSIRIFRFPFLTL